MLDLSKDQVRKALDSPDTPKKSTRRPSILDANQRQQLLDFTCSSKEARLMTYEELAHEFSQWGAGQEAIKNALDREGFSIRIAMCRPPISQKNRKFRLQFIIEHTGWTYHNWCKLLWSDETWVKHGRHMKTHALRRPREEWHEDCDEEKV